MQAIQVKYLQPTDHRGAGLKATCAAGSITIGYPYEFDGEKAFRFAAQCLCDKLGWNGQFVMGQLKNGDYVAVFLEQ